MASSKLTIAVPVYNETSVLPQLLSRTLAVLDSLPGGPHELLFVDDGSSDATLDLLTAAADQDSRIVIVSFARNFGHQAALTAALQHATGDAVVLMDGDLQDSPEAIPRFVDAYREGFDVAYAVRVKRKEGLWLRACYALFYRLISWMSDTRLPPDAGDFCLLSRRVVEELNAAPERHRYLRGLRAWVGFRQIGIPVERERRAAGKAKYNLRRLFRLAFDGIFSFSIVPLRAASVLGTCTVALSIAAALFFLYAKLFWRQSPQGFTALAVSIAFFAGVQLIFLGVIGEYVGRIYEEVKRRPLYVVDQVIRGRGTWKPNTHENIADCTNGTGGGVREKSSCST
jgi:dolichol-phosphate mannosyltransferase